MKLYNVSPELRSKMDSVIGTSKPELTPEELQSIGTIEIDTPYGTYSVSDLIDLPAEKKLPAVMG